MARSRGRWLVLGARALSAAAVVLVSRAVVAAPGLQYDVATECPQRAWFERELQRQELPSEVRGVLRVHVAYKPPPTEPSETLDKAAGVQRRTRQPEPEVEAAPGPPLLNAELEYDGGAMLVAEGSADTSSTDSVALQPEREPNPGADASDWQRTLSGANCEELLSVLAVSFAVYIESRDATQPNPVLQDDPLPPLVEPNFDPPKLDYIASATWRLGLSAGLGIRTGLAPSATGSWQVAIALRGVRPGWAAGPFQLGFGAQIGPNRDEISNLAGAASSLPERSWEQQYWTVHLLACPWMAVPTDALRLGPALGVHGGRFGATLPQVHVPDDDDEVWFAFYELLLLAEMQHGPVLGTIQAGLQLPVNPYRVAFEGRELHHQRAGLVLGLGLGWAGVLL